MGIGKESIGKCSYCKEEFKKKRKDSRFCSEKCRKNYYYDINPEYYERVKKKNLEHYYKKKGLRNAT